MFHRLLNLFFPERCVFCDELIPYQKSRICLCPDCAGSLVFLEDAGTCRLCGCPVAEDEGLCDVCLTHPRHFSRSVSCFRYEDAVRHAILQYKFYGRRDFCRGFAALLCRRVLPLHEEKPFDCVVCAPLSAAARRERGYHQTALLAEPVARALGIPFYKQAFLKVKDTPKQSTLNYTERMQNVEHVFRLNMPKSVWKGKRVLLVDDVLTTGATADSLSRLLLSAGAAEVVVATLAVTVRASEADVIY